MTKLAASLKYAVLSCGFFAASCAEPSSSSIGADDTPALPMLMDGTAVTANVRDLADGSWAVDYFFEEPKEAVFFPRSLGDYRTQSWTPAAGSPVVERVDGLDAMIFDAPTQTASYIISPHTEDVMGDYTPWLAFSDGSLALYTGQFELLDGKTRDAISALQGNLGAWEGEQGVLGVRVLSEEPMLFRSEPRPSPVETRSAGEGDYVVVGDTPLQEGASYIGVIDSALPPQISDSLDADLGEIFAHYESVFGYALPSRVSLLFAFGGFDHPGYSFSGSVIGDDLIVMSASGEVLRDYPPGIRRHILWFFAHEGAHLFQGVDGVMPGLGADSWIHEGSANAMAVETIMAMGAGNEGYRRSELNTALGGCAPALANGPLNTLAGQMHYDCGQLFFVMADADLPEANVYDIWRAIQDTVRTRDIEAVTTEIVIETFAELGVQDALVEQIEALVFEETSEPHTDILRAMETRGMSFELDEDGQLVSLRMP